MEPLPCLLITLAFTVSGSVSGLRSVVVTTAPVSTVTDCVGPMAFTTVAPLNVCPPVKSTVLASPPELVAVSVIPPVLALIVPLPLILRLNPAALAALMLPAVAVKVPALAMLKSEPASPLTVIELPEIVFEAAVLNVPALIEMLCVALMLLLTLTKLDVRLTLPKFRS